MSRSGREAHEGWEYFVSNEVVYAGEVEDRERVEWNSYIEDYLSGYIWLDGVVHGLCGEPESRSPLSRGTNRDIGFRVKLLRHRTSYKRTGSSNPRQDQPQDLVAFVLADELTWTEPVLLQHTAGSRVVSENASRERSNAGLGAAPPYQPIYQFRRETQAP